MADTMDPKMMYAFLQMADLDAQEKRLQQQQAQADMLRKESMSPGYGVAGGLARGLQGVMAGYQQQQANKSLDALSQNRQDWLKKIGPSFGMYGGGGGDPNDFYEG